MKSIAYSLEEVKSANLSVKQLRFNGYRIDTRRNSCKEENVATLKKLELKPIPKVVRKAKEPKPKKEKKPKEKKAKDDVPAASKGESKPAEASKIASLDKLDGITEKDINKLKDMGIDTPAKLASEDIKEVSKITKITQKQLKAWIEQIQG